MLKPMYNRVHEAQEAQEMIHTEMNIDIKVPPWASYSDQ